MLRSIHRLVSFVIVFCLVTQVISPVFAYILPNSIAQVEENDTLSEVHSAVSPTNETTEIMTSLYLPLIFKNYGPNLVRQEIDASIGGKLKAPNGVVIEVPANAFPEDGYLTYHPVQSQNHTSQDKIELPQGVELQVFANNGNEFPSLNLPIEVQVPYSYVDLQGVDEFTIEVYRSGLNTNSNNSVNLSTNSISEEPIPSQVDPHRFQVIFNTTEGGQFNLLAEPTVLSDECTTAEVGRGASSQALINSMCIAFTQAGGIATMGVATSSSLGDVHNWGNTQVQDFTGGTLIKPLLMYRNDNGISYYMGRPMIIAYDNISDPDSYIGMPTSYPHSEGPASFVDDNNDFRGGSVMYFDHGFIGFDSRDGAMESHRYFPEIKQVTWQTTWQETGETDSGGNPEYEFVFSASVDDVDPNPSGKNGDNPAFYTGFWVEVTDDSGLDNGHLSLAMGETGEVTFANNYTSTHQLTPYRFYFFAWRPAPDDLSGYYYCSHAYADPEDNGWVHGQMTTQGSHSVTVDCESAGGGVPDLPPQVSITETWADGHGNLSVKAQATDDRGITSVTIQSDNGDVFTPEMSPWPSDGTNIYAGTIRNVPPNDKVYFTVTATDTAGQTATVDQDNRVKFTMNCGGCGSGLRDGAFYTGNPVNTATGNDSDTYIDLIVPGRGGTDIVVNRSYNSQDDRSGPLGQGTSFEYDMFLEVVDNPLVQGIHLRYGNGRTANFNDTGTGRYDPMSPSNFDYIEKDGSEYVLHRKNRTAYRFNSDGRLTAIVNKNGHAITLAYDGNGDLGTITNASNRTVELDWTGDHITEIRAPEGKQLNYQYDGDLMRYFTNANRKVTEYRYDANGRLTTIISPNGYPMKRQALDDRGRVMWQIVGAEERRDFVYNDDTRTTVVTDSEGNQITYVYDEKYYALSKTDGRENTEYFTYDDRGNLIKYTDRRENSWYYAYDDNGNRIYQEDPAMPDDPYASYDEDITRWVYNNTNDVLSTTNAIGFTTSFDYDGNGNLLHTYLPDGAVITMTYNGYGQVLTLTDGEGNTSTNVYDPTTGDLTEMINGVGDSTHFVYDDLGRQIEIIDAEGHSVAMAYDGNDNILEVRDGKGISSTFKYDDNDNLIELYDRRGGNSSYHSIPSPN